MTKKILFLTLSLCMGMMSACQPVKTLETQVSTVNPGGDEAFQTVTINNSNQINYAPIFLAEAAGYFEDYGIKLETVPFSIVTDAVPLLATGQLDVYAGSNSTGLINVFGQEPNVKAVANRGEIIQGDCTFQAILVRKDLYDSGAVTGPGDLAGLKIAATNNATRGFHLSSYLAKGGLTFEDVEINNMPTSSFFDALDNKTIDVFVIPELTLSRLIQYGNVVMIDKAEDSIGPYVSSILAYGKRLIHDDPDLGVRFMAAYLKGVMLYNQGKTDANLQIMSEKTGEDIEMLKQACWVHIPSDGSIDFSAVEPFIEWSIDQEQLESRISEDQFFNGYFLSQATKLLDK